MNEQGPNFFVIGAARSGTTALAEMLRAHPDAFVTQPKEPHYLAFAGRELAFTGPGDDMMMNTIAVVGHDDYLALYAGADGKAARGDASVSTLYYAEDAVATIERHFPAARVAVILREPVDRAFSAYSYLRVRGFEPLEDFLAAVDEEETRRELGWHHLWHYVEMGRYARRLRTFLDALGADRVKVIFYDDLDSDPAAVGSELYEFLGLDSSLAAAGDRVNVSGSPRSGLAQSAMWWATRHPHLRATVKALTPFSLRERMRRANLAPTRASLDARIALERVFTDEVAELRSLLDEHYPGLADAGPAWISECAVYSR